MGKSFSWGSIGCFGFCSRLNFVHSLNLLRHVMGDVGTFVTLLHNIFQIFIVVKDFFSALRTTSSIYPTDR